DRNVTGVQTCALPILSARSQISPLLRPAAIRLRQRCCLIRPRLCTVSNTVDLNIQQWKAPTMTLIHIDSHQVEKTLSPKQAVLRSEERRVGKVGQSGW